MESVFPKLPYNLPIRTNSDESHAYSVSVIRNGWIVQRWNRATNDEPSVGRLCLHSVCAHCLEPPLQVT